MYYSVQIYLLRLSNFSINILKELIRTPMNFTNYLIEMHKSEQILTENHELLLQKLIDALDYSHVDYDASKISFDIGSVTGTPKLNGLKVVIRPSSEDSIRLGRDANGGYAIVVDTTKDMPSRADIDTFLSAKDIYGGFSKAYKQYVKKYFDSEKEYEPSSTEKSLQTNSREGFEDGYETLIAAIRANAEQYSKAAKDIDSQLGNMGNVGKKASLALAKQNLKDDYFGKSEKEFLSKVYALPEAEFSKILSPEWKEKLESRLKQFYNSINPTE